MSKEYLAAIDKIGKLNNEIKNLQTQIHELKINKVDWENMSKYLDGRITNAKEMLDSEGYINAETRLKLEGEYEALKALRVTFNQWKKETIVAIDQRPKCPKCGDETYIIDWDNDRLMCISCGHYYPM